MLVGLARTSTTDQAAGLEAQQRALKAAGVDKLYVEQASAVGERPVLESAIDWCREGDALVVSDLSRLARSVADFVSIQKRLALKKVDLRVLGIGLDTATPTGVLILGVLAAVAQWERETMLARQREGIAKAKREGRYRGRKPTARAKAAEVLALDAQRVRKTEIAERLGISARSVHRIIAGARASSRA